MRHVVLLYCISTFCCIYSCSFACAFGHNQHNPPCCFPAMTVLFSCQRNLLVGLIQCWTTTNDCCLHDCFLPCAGAAIPCIGAANPNVLVQTSNTKAIFKHIGVASGHHGLARTCLLVISGHFTPMQVLHKDCPQHDRALTPCMLKKCAALQGK